MATVDTHAPEVLVVKEERCVFASPAACAAFGRELLGAPVLELGVALAHLHARPDAGRRRARLAAR